MPRFWQVCTDASPNASLNMQLKQSPPNLPNLLYKPIPFRQIPNQKELREQGPETGIFSVQNKRRLKKMVQEMKGTWVAKVWKGNERLASSLW